MEEGAVGNVRQRHGNFLVTTSVVLLALIVLGGLALAVLRVTAVTLVDNYEIGYAFHLTTGKVTVLDKKGWIVQWPLLVKVHTFDLRPMQVCISAIQRVLNCKLVQFDPAGLELFVSWHGRGNYTNEGGSREHPTWFNQALMAYAYDGSGERYPFLKVLRDLKPGDVEGSK